MIQILLAVRNREIPLYPAVPIYTICQTLIHEYGAIILVIFHGFGIFSRFVMQYYVVCIDEYQERYVDLDVRYLGGEGRREHHESTILQNDIKGIL